jgi:hypothetical protein
MLLFARRFAFHLASTAITAETPAPQHNESRLHHSDYRARCGSDGMRAESRENDEAYDGRQDEISLDEIERIAI